MTARPQHGNDLLVSASELEALRKATSAESVGSNANRFRRIISWIERAESLYDQSDPDWDGSFLFYWIAFNAAYDGGNSTDYDSAMHRIEDLLGSMLSLDSDQRIYNIVWIQFSTSVRTLLENKYIFQPYWDFQTGKDSNSDWETEFQRQNIQAAAWLGNRGRCQQLLSLVFRRLYVLRNQLVHGSATYQGSINRDQVRDGAKILRCFIPRFAKIMLENPKTDWGPISYPAINIGR